MLFNAWQYAPPVEPVGSDGGISDPLRFVPPAAADEAYLVTELGNVFLVNDDEDDTGEDNGNQEQQDGDNVAIGVGVATASFLKVVNIPTGKDLIYSNGTHADVVELSPRHKLPAGTNFVTVVSSDINDTSVIRFDVPRFDAEYHYNNGNLTNYTAIYPESFSHTGSIYSQATNATLYRLDDGLLGKTTYVTPGSNDAGTFVTFAESARDIIGTWELGKGHPVYHAEGNHTQITNYCRNVRYTPYCNFTILNTVYLSSPSRTTFETTGHDNLYWELEYTTENTFDQYPYDYFTNSYECPPYSWTNYMGYTYLDSDSYNGSSIPHSIRFSGSDLTTAVYSRLQVESSSQHFRNQTSSCTSANIYDTPVLKSAMTEAVLNIWDSGFIYDTIERFDSSGGFLYTIPDDGPVYLVTGPDRIGASMVSFDDVYFIVRGLPPDTPYKMLSGSNVISAGVTSQAGTIRQPLSSIEGAYFGMGGEIRLFPGVPYLTGQISMAVFDLENGEIVNIGVADGDVPFAYVPTVYAKAPFPVDTEINDVTLDGVPLHQLSGNYDQGDAMMVPILPRTDEIKMTVSGMEITMHVADMRVEKTNSVIKSRTDRFNQIVGGNSPNPSLTSNAFTIATADGIMTIDLSTWISGSARQSVTTEFNLELDRNDQRTDLSGRNIPDRLVGQFSSSLSYWSKRHIDPIECYSRGPSGQLYNCGANRNAWPDALADARARQPTLDADYDDYIYRTLNNAARNGIGAYATIYKNGEFMDHKSIGGITPTQTLTTETPDVTAYWPSTVYAQKYRPQGSNVPTGIVIGVHPLEVSFERSMTFPQQSVRNLIEVEVERGDLVEVVMRATMGISQNPALDHPYKQLDPRVHEVGRSEMSTGSISGVLRIHGGIIDTHCCAPP